MEQYNAVKANRKQIFVNNFIGGISWALGATIGLTLIVVVLGIVAKNINLVPFVGKFVADVIAFVLQNNPHLVK